MKRKKIEIMTIVFIVLCSIVLYVIETTLYKIIRFFGLIKIQKMKIRVQMC